MPEAEPSRLIRRFGSGWIGLSLPAAESDEPAIRHWLRPRQKTTAAFRIGILLVIELVTFRRHFAHTAARQSKGTRRRPGVLRRLWQDRRKKNPRFLWFAGDSARTDG